MQPVPLAEQKLKRCENMNLEMELISLSTFISRESFPILGYQPVSGKAAERDREKCLTFG